MTAQVSAGRFMMITSPALTCVTLVSTMIFVPGSEDCGDQVCTLGCAELSFRRITASAMVASDVVIMTTGTNMLVLDGLGIFINGLVC